MVPHQLRTTGICPIELLDSAAKELVQLALTADFSRQSSEIQAGGLERDVGF